MLRLGMLHETVLAMDLTSVIYIGVDSGAGPRDRLMLAMKHIGEWSLCREFYT
jgi:uncharacterized membrane protein YczE